MPVHFLWFLFDWRGRISRSAYRIAMLVLALSVAALQLAPNDLHGILVGLLVAQLVVQAALDAKRLHDIGYSAHWVTYTGLACIAAVAAVAALAPGGMALVAQHARDILGPSAAKDGPLAIALAGLEGAAVLRSSLLWAPKSNAAGDAYQFAPGKWRPAKPGATASSRIDADALIAKALAAQQAQERDASGAAAAPTTPARTTTFGARKNFGTRRSA